ncbi:MAG: PorT family protein [Chitinophagaceae bacterium]|nr:PorT family protein [Chitinophagaceae bacterium]
MNPYQAASLTLPVNPVEKILKPVILLIIALAITTFSFAQGGFHIGVKGGVNMYKIDGRSFSDEFKHSYNAGLFAEINFSKKVGIQPELLWNQSQTRTSTRFKDIYDEGIGELKGVTLNYLSVPLLLNVSPSKFVTFQAGPQFGVLISKDQNLLENGKAAFKTGDLSMLGGVQLNLGGVKVGGRYMVGLTNINDIDNQDKWRNQGFQLYAGFRLL